VSPAPDPGRADRHLPERSQRRERLLRALIDEVALSGYRATTIGQITARAQVSRTTFYEHFTHKLDCFLAAFRELAEQLAGRVQRDLARSRHLNGAAVGLGPLFDLAEHERSSAVILLHEPAAAGIPATDERDRLLSRIEQALELEWHGAPDGLPVPNLPARALVGAAARELAIRLHRREPVGELRQELAGWSASYIEASPADRRAACDGPPAPAGSLVASRLRGRADSAPATSPRPAQSERIARAVAELAERASYPQVTVTGIAARAGVNREAFYRHFTDKESAYIAALRLVFEGAIAATAAGFFGPRDWRERVWNGLQGLLGFLDGERALAHIALAEPYAVGPEAIELIIEKQLGFSLFLEDGRGYEAGSERASGVPSNLIVCAIFELLARQLRERPEDSLISLLPEVTYVALAPFVGADAATDFVTRKVRVRRVRQPGPQLPRERG